MRLWTNSQAIQSWWGDPKSYRTVGWTSDLRNGGSWRAECEAVSGDRVGASGTYTTVVSPTHLERTWTPDWDPSVVKISAMIFGEHPDGAVLGVTCTGFKDQADQLAREQGWQELIGGLERQISRAGHPASPDSAPTDRQGH